MSSVFSPSTGGRPAISVYADENFKLDVERKTPNFKKLSNTIRKNKVNHNNNRNNNLKSPAFRSPNQGHSNATTATAKKVVVSSSLVKSVTKDYGAFTSSSKPKAETLVSRTTTITELSYQGNTENIPPCSDNTHMPKQTNDPDSSVSTREKTVALKLTTNNGKTKKNVHETVQSNGSVDTSSSETEALKAQLAEVMAERDRIARALGRQAEEFTLFRAATRDTLEAQACHSVILQASHEAEMGSLTREKEGLLRKVISLDEETVNSRNSSSNSYKGKKHQQQQKEKNLVQQQQQTQALEDAANTKTTITGLPSEQVVDAEATTTCSTTTTAHHIVLSSHEKESLQAYAASLAIQVAALHRALIDSEARAAVATAAASRMMSVSSVVAPPQQQPQLLLVQDGTTTSTMEYHNHLKNSSPEAEELIASYEAYLHAIGDGAIVEQARSGGVVDIAAVFETRSAGIIPSSSSYSVSPSLAGRGAAVEDEDVASAAVVATEGNVPLPQTPFSMASSSAEFQIMSNIPVSSSPTLVDIALASSSSASSSSSMDAIVPSYSPSYSFYAQQQQQQQQQQQVTTTTTTTTTTSMNLSPMHTVYQYSQQPRGGNNNNYSTTRPSTSASSSLLSSPGAPDHAAVMRMIEEALSPVKQQEDAKQQQNKATAPTAGVAAATIGQNNTRQQEITKKKPQFFDNLYHHQQQQQQQQLQSALAAAQACIKFYHAAAVAAEMRATENEADVEASKALVAGLRAAIMTHQAAASKHIAEHSALTDLLQAANVERDGVRTLNATLLGTAKNAELTLRAIASVHLKLRKEIHKLVASYTTTTTTTSHGGSGDGDQESSTSPSSTTTSAFISDLKSILEKDVVATARAIQIATGGAAAAQKEEEEGEAEEKEAGDNSLHPVDELKQRPAGDSGAPMTLKKQQQKKLSSLPTTTTRLRRARSTGEMMMMGGNTTTATKHTHVDASTSPLSFLPTVEANTVDTFAATSEATTGTTTTAPTPSSSSNLTDTSYSLPSPGAASTRSPSSSSPSFFNANFAHHHYDVMSPYLGSTTITMDKLLARMMRSPNTDDVGSKAVNSCTKTEHLEEEDDEEELAGFNIDLNAYSRSPSVYSVASLRSYRSAAELMMTELRRNFEGSSYSDYKLTSRRNNDEDAEEADENAYDTTELSPMSNATGTYMNSNTNHTPFYHHHHALSSFPAFQNSSSSSKKTPASAAAHMRTLRYTSAATPLSASKFTSSIQQQQQPPVLSMQVVLESHTDEDEEAIAAGEAKREQQEKSLVKSVSVGVSTDDLAMLMNSPSAITTSISTSSTNFMANPLLHAAAAIAAMPQPQTPSSFLSSNNNNSSSSTTKNTEFSDSPFVVSSLAFNSSINKNRNVNGVFADPTAHSPTTVSHENSSRSSNSLIAGIPSLTARQFSPLFAFAPPPAAPAPSQMEPSFAFAPPFTPFNIAATANSTTAVTINSASPSAKLIQATATALEAQKNVAESMNRHQQLMFEAKRRRNNNNSNNGGSHAPKLLVNSSNSNNSVSGAANRRITSTTSAGNNSTKKMKENSVGPLVRSPAPALVGFGYRPLPSSPTSTKQHASIVVTSRSIEEDHADSVFSAPGPLTPSAFPASFGASFMKSTTKPNTTEKNKNINNKSIIITTEDAFSDSDSEKAYDDEGEGEKDLVVDENSYTNDDDEGSSSCDVAAAVVPPPPTVQIDLEALLLSKANITSETGGRGGVFFHETASSLAKKQQQQQQQPPHKGSIKPKHVTARTTVLVARYGGGGPNSGNGGNSSITAAATNTQRNYNNRSSSSRNNNAATSAAAPAAPPLSYHTKTVNVAARVRGYGGGSSANNSSANTSRRNSLVDTDVATATTTTTNIAPPPLPDFLSFFLGAQ